MELWICLVLTGIGCVGLVLIESWSDIKRLRDDRWEKKCNKKKIVI